MRPTLPEALLALVEAGPPIDDDAVAPPDDQVDDDATPEVLIEQALELFLDADEALAEGDLGAYQAFNDQARALLERAAQLQGVEVPEVEPTPAPTPAPGDGSTDPDESASEAGPDPAITEAAG